MVFIFKKKDHFILQVRPLRNTVDCNKKLQSEMWDNFFLSRAIGLPFGGLQAIVPSVLWRVGRLLNASGELLIRLVFAVSVEKQRNFMCVSPVHTSKDTMWSRKSMSQALTVFSKSASMVGRFRLLASFLTISTAVKPRPSSFKTVGSGKTPSV